jgi:hypothetical protein
VKLEKKKPISDKKNIVNKVIFGFIPIKNIKIVDEVRSIGVRDFLKYIDPDVANDIYSSLKIEITNIGVNINIEI